MTINEIGIGASLCLGSLVPPFNTAMIDLIWTKVSNNNLFMLNNGGAINMPMDAREPASSSRQRRTRGNSFFPQTALFQWLNAAGKGWYTPCSDTDNPPSYQMCDGFLTGFSDLERSALLVQEIPIITPEGFKKDFGQRTSARCLVSLPSISQLYPVREDTSDALLAFEGDLFAVRSGDHDRLEYAWTRTARNGYMLTAHERGYGYAANAPCESLYVYPVIQLKPDAQVDGYDNAFALKPIDGSSLSVVKESELEKIWLQ